MRIPVGLGSLPCDQARPDRRIAASARCPDVVADDDAVPRI
jgi:hypothetical protein